MIINVCYTVFYNVKLGISFPHRGLWSTRFVWHWLKLGCMVLCHHAHRVILGQVLQPFLPPGCGGAQREVMGFIKFQLLLGINTSPAHTEEWLNYLDKHFWQPCLRTVRPKLSWVRCWAGWIWALSLPVLGTEGLGWCQVNLKQKKAPWLFCSC